MRILTQTSKMPCPSFSLPAWDSCPGAKYAEANLIPAGAASPCSICYARKGFYRMPNVRDSRAERFVWARRHVDACSFADVMSAEIRATGCDFFRVHDSGDFYSTRYVDAWRDITRALPRVRFWYPTRAYTLKAFLPALRRLASEPNAIVRPSALVVDAPAPKIPGLDAGSSVVTRDATCPAPSQGGTCGSCRACWDSRMEVSYARHWGLVQGGSDSGLLRRMVR